MLHKFLLTCVIILAGLNIVNAQQQQVIRIARIVIDSSQIDQYRSALAEEIEASVRLEPGVLTLYAVSDQQRPTHVTVFEIYADNNAYLSHIRTPHFLKYKQATASMVKSLELTENTPIRLAAKPGNKYLSP